MNDLESLKQKLSEDGFVHIFEWEDAPHTFYEEHAHKGAVTLLILKGDLTFSFKDTNISLTKGQRFDVPIGKKHTALVGPQGCSYIVGEMIKGDS